MPVRPWAIVPAFNEVSTVASVVDVLLRSPRLAGVLVVDDGSSDGTSEAAEAAGADVLALSPNRGKAQAMRAAIAEVPGDHIAFFDADLTGLTPEHVELLCRHADVGWDLVCGLREYGILNAVQLLMPLITGERVVRRWVLDAVHESCWDGYAIELAMNDACARHGGRIIAAPLKGLRIRGKVKKFGFLDGLAGHAKMFSRLDEVQCSLEEEGTCER